MLRTLLEDQLKLAVHRETKEMQGYALVIARGGFQAQAGGTCRARRAQLRSYVPKPRSARGLPAIHPACEEGLNSFPGRPCDAGFGTRWWSTDGFTGVFDFELRWNNDDHNPAPGDSDSLPILLTAIQETLGLKLQPEKVPVETIVVEHVERVPIEY